MIRNIERAKYVIHKTITKAFTTIVFIVIPPLVSLIVHVNQLNDL